MCVCVCLTSGMSTTYIVMECLKCTWIDCHSMNFVTEVSQIERSGADPASGILVSARIDGCGLFCCHGDDVCLYCPV